MTVLLTDGDERDELMIFLSTNVPLHQIHRTAKLPKGYTTGKKSVTYEITPGRNRNKVIQFSVCPTRFVSINCVRFRIPQTENAQ